MIYYFKKSDIPQPYWGGGYDIIESFNDWMFECRSPPPQTGGGGDTGLSGFPLRRYKNHAKSLNNQKKSDILKKNDNLAPRKSLGPYI